MLTFISAFLIGFLSGFHCLGMCGPIALSLPVHHLAPVKKFNSVFLYNFGRLLSYSILGFLFGWLGSRFFLAGYQRILSLTVGTILLFGALGYYFPNLKFIEFKFRFNFIQKIKNAISFMWNRRSLFSFLILGVLNGFLPCGMVYLATTGALLTENFYEGFVFMIFFGLGTFPLMIVLTYFGKLVSVQTRLYMTKLVPVFVMMMALLFIFRGMNLGIPYLSPEFNKVNITEINCH